MTKPRHVLGISGGKDSAALAIYLRNTYPQLDIEYYYCDTGKELDETYQLIERLEGYLGKPIAKLKSKAAEDLNKNPFDYFYQMYRGYLPSNVARWCTKNMKIEPFELFVGDMPTISYVGIRGDEDREGYISKKSSIQSIFPFRRNIWSEEVIKKLLSNKEMSHALDLYGKYVKGTSLDKISEIIQNPLVLEDRNPEQNRKATQAKLNQLLDQGVSEFNQVMFDYLKADGNYPISTEEDYPLLYNEDVLVRDDIFRLLEESEVGVPSYYNKIDYSVDGETGQYARSRSGCYFCFFQQKIEWVWLYEQHPDLYFQAVDYENEKEGFTWNQNETLKDLIHPNRIHQIKTEHLTRMDKLKNNGSKYLLDKVIDAEKDCIACFK
ncbi:MAG: phosphoadenosine phosphosulfate reductase [Flammeovirgaceae bacterium]|nr:phosphoadenosine phosphosulfate reductase [Flammeovirgaceae bacterium]MBE62057.1 phosphoadenosine phosphosulfate reductase [Flammeovirgaceae bacterium]|tara:strand:- start:6093 stop:7232 length:1140 start_codon:yes stop_codon:yes gene_type:complete